MAESKDSPKSGFFRKVVRFALNPTTDWADLNAVNPETGKEEDYAKTELKAMIERKRRNDFVRKREFDMLRKIRREGLSSEGLAGLAGLSHLDDSEVRSQQDYGSRPDNDEVKDKIDAIERQMVGENLGSSVTPSRRGAAVMGRASPPARTESFFSATTAPQIMPAQPLADAFKPTTPMRMGTESDNLRDTGGSTLDLKTTLSDPVPASAVVPGRRLSVSGLLDDVTGPGTMEVTELAHDPDLDEAVIAFANADFELCERSLQSLTSPSGMRSRHADTWHALFDLYRATGQQLKFDALALDYTQRFGTSPPQWFSLPKLVADAAVHERTLPSAALPVPHQFDGTVGWVAPDLIDADAVAQLRSQLLQMPLPWVLDWRQVRHLDPQGASALNRLLREWADDAIEMRWLSGERLFALLAEVAPTGVRDADPAYWMLRLEALRLAQRSLDFDQVAIDYCITYEVSPPSWSPAQCVLRLSDDTGMAIAPVSGIAEVITGFMESQTPDEGMLEVATVELNGQLIGDIGNLLKGMDQQIGGSTIINVSCARLIRIDFIAAGDLLNWVLARRTEGRSVTFMDAHRLVALFCGAMGITEHARVTVRNI